MFYLSDKVSRALLSRFVCFGSRTGVYLFILFLVGCISVASAQMADMKFEHITSQDGLPQNTIHGIVKDKYGFMWFGTWGGLCRYDGYTFKTYTFDPDNKNSISNNRIHNIIKDKDQNIWIRTFEDDEVCRYNYEKDNFDRIKKAALNARFMELLNRRHHIETVNFTYKQYRWSLDVPRNSLLETDLKSNRKSIYKVSPSNPWSLNDIYATDIYKDNHNVFWVGTFSNGINKANLNAKPFEHFYHIPFNSASIIDNNVRGICEDKGGNLWIGTRDQGITVIGKGKGNYRHISSNGSSINDNQIRSVYCDSRGIIWIGTKAGLNSYNPANDTFRNFDKEGINGVNIFGIAEDNKQNVLFATWNGVYKYVSSENRLLHLDYKMQLPFEVYTKAVFCDKKGQIWVGTEGGGLIVLKSLTGSGKVKVIKRFVHQSHRNSLTDNRINYLYEDKQGIIWIGNGNGLDCYDPKKNRFTHFSAKNGFPESPVMAILEDNKGYLWISHKKGISQLHSKTFEVRNFTQQDGLQSNEFSDAAGYKSPFTNKLYFGGNNGFNSFNPDSILPEKTVPNTVLINLQILSRQVGINEEINGRVVLTKPLYLTNKIDLTYGDKSVSIEFAGLHYSNPKGNKYAYKLDGFDKDWIYTDAARRTATYSNLEPGDYTFKVISSNSDGIWNKKPALLKISVKPPFWASAWAYLLYLAVLCALLYVYHIYSLRISRLKAKLSYELLIREKETELHQNKLQFFTNISHEIKTPLTLILAPLEMLLQMFPENKSVKTQLNTMKSSGDRLLKLLNQLLDFRKLETGNTMLKIGSHDMILFIKNTLSSFESLAENRRIRLELECAIESFVFKYDEDQLEKVFANLLFNALKFTPEEGIIRVSFEVRAFEQEPRVLITVSNTGKGIPENELETIFRPFKQGSGSGKGGTGLGLAFSRSLVELHGGSINVKSEPLSNSLHETSFVVELPVKAVDEEVSGQETESVVVNQFITLSDNSFSKPVREEQIRINGKVPSILIVEDNVELRRYLKEYFESSYQTFEAVNGKAGLEMALRELPDLILSDVMMDEMDGLEFCRHIKAEIKTAHIPVILLTAKDPVEDRIEGMDTGADDYITKPFNLDFLTARIKNLLISRQQLKDRYRKDVSAIVPANVPLSPDEKLLKNFLDYVEEHLSNPQLNIEAICENVGMSRSHLYSKIKAVTGLGIAEIIKEARLKRAKYLLKEKRFNVNEVAYMVGFSDTDYFRKCFKAEFGQTPSEFAKAE